MKPGGLTHAPSAGAPDTCTLCWCAQGLLWKWGAGKEKERGIEGNLLVGWTFSPSHIHI